MDTRPKVLILKANLRRLDWGIQTMQPIQDSTP